MEKTKLPPCKVPASFDAKDWAEEFNNVLVRKGEQPYDPGWLIGWFANALMRGYDEYARKHPEPLTKISEEDKKGIKDTLEGIGFINKDTHKLEFDLFELDMLIKYIAKFTRPSVKLPEKKEQYGYDDEILGWNKCIDKVIEMNSLEK